MKKIIIIAVIGLLGIGALFGSTEEDVPQETEAVEETEVVEETEAESEEEQEAKQKAEEEDRKQEEERKAKEEQEAEEEEAKQKAEEEQKAKQKAEEEAEAQAKAEEAEKLRKENEAKEKAEQEAENEDAEELYLQIMKENLGMYVSVEFDEANKIFKLTPIDQDLITAISMLPNGVGHKEWGVMVDALASMSDTGMGLVGEGYTINLVNPLNPDNVILWIIDGVIIYNVVDDL